MCTFCLLLRCKEIRKSTGQQDSNPKTLINTGYFERHVKIRVHCMRNYTGRRTRMDRLLHVVAYTYGIWDIQSFDLCKPSKAFWRTKAKSSSMWEMEPTPARSLKGLRRFALWYKFSIRDKGTWNTYVVGKERELTYSRWLIGTWRVFRLGSLSICLLKPNGQMSCLRRSTGGSYYRKWRSVSYHQKRYYQNIARDFSLRFEWR